VTKRAAGEMSQATASAISSGAPTPSFDCFSPRSAFSAAGVGAEAQANQTKVRSVMVEYGFRPYEPEWWHLTLDAEAYPDTYFDFPVR
jgi:zinc D-Ala-D-Ala dipeptidase